MRYRIHEIKIKKFVIEQKLNINQSKISKQKSCFLDFMEFHQKYTILQQLKTSSNNDMFKAKRNSDSKTFMIKKVHYSRMQQKQKQQIVQQVNILTQINSSSIVKYCEHFVQKTQNTLYVVMQYEPIDLSQILRKYQQQGKYLSQDKIWRLMKDLVIGLKEIHKNKKGIILHRNIQPKSVFINNNSIKLGNFKFVKKLDTEEQFATTILTDTYYMSPQQLEDGVFTPKTDIWALGCLLYEICTFTNPYQGNSAFEIGNKIRQGKLKPLPSIYKRQINRVIRWCLTKDPKDRPSVEDLLGVPMINLLIRQNRLNEVNKKISEKQSKAALLEDEISQLQQKLFSLRAQKTRNTSKSNNSDLSKQSLKDISSQKLNGYDSNFKRFEQITLKRGVSDKLNEKTHYLKHISSSIAQLNYYASIGQTPCLTKISQSLVKGDQNTFRKLNF